MICPELSGTKVQRYKACSTVFWLVQWKSIIFVFCDFVSLWIYLKIMYKTEWVEYPSVALQCEIDGKHLYFLPEWSQNSGWERTLQEIMVDIEVFHDKTLTLAGNLPLSTIERLFKTQYILVQVLLAYLNQHQELFSIFSQKNWPKRPLELVSMCKSFIFLSNPADLISLIFAF